MRIWSGCRAWVAAGDFCPAGRAGWWVRRTHLAGCGGGRLRRRPRRSLCWGTTSSTGPGLAGRAERLHPERLVPCSVPDPCETDRVVATVAILEIEGSERLVRVVGIQNLGHRCRSLSTGVSAAVFGRSRTSPPQGRSPAASQALPHSPRFIDVAPRNGPPVGRRGGAEAGGADLGRFGSARSLLLGCLAVDPQYLASVTVCPRERRRRSLTTRRHPPIVVHDAKPEGDTGAPPPTNAQARRRVQILLAGGPPARQIPSRSIKAADRGSDKSYLTEISASEKILRSTEGFLPDSVLDRGHRSGYLTTGCPPTKQNSARRPGSPRFAGGGAEERVAELGVASAKQWRLCLVVLG